MVLLKFRETPCYMGRACNASEAVNATECEGGRGSGWLRRPLTAGWLRAGEQGMQSARTPLGLLPHPLARTLGVSLAACWAGIRGFDAKSYEIFFHPSSFGITRQKCPRNVSYSASITDSISAGRTSREGGSMGSMERCEGRMERELSEDCRRSDGERS